MTRGESKGEKRLMDGWEAGVLKNRSRKEVNNVLKEGEGGERIKRKKGKKGSLIIRAARGK